ncbi:DNA-directed RNA polymerase subunit omega [Rubrobacter tropicus]|uniref:DNA-directed RNA polymerase subunit omega n=1 Tax=Rubrobacter tropicus TaxID=2653851 RepID=A0A6G8Q979_9ACTN|nr:DNA-directed RNA polymerase subunit omega [Rubrobacter tropicus]QIN83044.1 DNA-directed RNA polymerase subunit omega [Rubrobacter tropicus]
MLNDLKIDELLSKVDSRYGLVVSSAKRARQINEYTSTLGLNDALGIPGPQVHTRSQHPLTIAIEELRQDKLDVVFKQQPEEVEDQVGAAGGDDFVSPPGGAGSPEATSVDSGAPADDEQEGAGAA